MEHQIHVLVPAFPGWAPFRVWEDDRTDTKHPEQNSYRRTVQPQTSRFALHDSLSILLEPTSSLQLILLCKYLVIAGRFVFGGMNGWGWPNFIRHKTLKSKSGGYLVGSNCIVKADISVTGLSCEGLAGMAWWRSDALASYGLVSECVNMVAVLRTHLMNLLW